MSFQNQGISFFQFASTISSSYIASQIQSLNEVSIKFVMDEKLSLVLDQPQTLQPLKRQLSQEILLLQLKRHTSFQQILVQNHKKIIMVSLQQYLKVIDHPLKIQLNQLNQTIQLNIQDLKLQHTYLQKIVQKGELSQEKQTQIIKRLKHNLDQVNLIYNIIKRCPQEIQFQLIFIIYSIFSLCDVLIQNFKRKTIAKELKDKAIQIKKSLREQKLLIRLFQTSKDHFNQQSFEILIQKMLISLFLMKIGVFNNELETKTIQQCLRSQMFKQIRLNDLFNNHLMKPTKKRKIQ